MAKVSGCPGPRTRARSAATRSSGATASSARLPSSATVNSGAGQWPRCESVSRYGHVESAPPRREEKGMAVNSAATSGEGGVPTPFHSQLIAHGGPCGKAPVMTQNLRSKPMSMHRGVLNACGAVRLRFARGRRAAGRARGAVAGARRAGAGLCAAGRGVREAAGGGRGGDGADRAVGARSGDRADAAVTGRCGPAGGRPGGRVLRRRHVGGRGVRRAGGDRSGAAWWPGCGRRPRSWASVTCTRVTSRSACRPRTTRRCRAPGGRSVRT